MGYKNFIENGRVINTNCGSNQGKLAVVIDILNERRVLIDGPLLGVDRQLMPLKRVVPTKFTVPILRNPRPGNFEKSVAESDPKKKFDETRRGKETTSDVKKNSLGDFERFKASMTKKQIAKKVQYEAKKIK